MKKVPPRLVPSWDEFYMGMVFMHASRSKDPSTQHGAVIVDKDNLPRGWGYNGTLKKILDKEVNWRRPDKYAYVIHAEENALRRCKNVDVTGGTCYVTGFPCSRCALQIMDEGIRRIVFGPQSSACVPEDMIEEIKEVAKLANVTLDRYVGSLNWLGDRLVNLKTKLPELF